MTTTRARRIRAGYDPRSRPQSDDIPCGTRKRIDPRIGPTVTYKKLGYLQPEPEKGKGVLVSMILLVTQPTAFIQESRFLRLISVKPTKQVNSVCIPFSLLPQVQQVLIEMSDINTARLKEFSPLLEPSDSSVRLRIVRTREGIIIHKEFRDACDAWVHRLEMQESAESMIEIPRIYIDNLLSTITVLCDTRSDDIAKSIAEVQTT